MRPILLVVVLAACGSSSSSIDAKVADAPKVDAMKDGPSTPMLTVKNFDTWCSVTIGTGSPSVLTQQSVPITASGPITLKASPNGTNFEDSGNMWHHTDGDGGTGETGTVVGTGVSAVSTATVTVVAGTSKCVWVCCPFSSDHSGCTGLPDACL